MKGKLEKVGIILVILGQYHSQIHMQFEIKMEWDSEMEKYKK